jgi:thiamine-monophosphate kinase
MTTLRDLGENGLIQRFRALLPDDAPADLLTGIGDDCAVLRLGGEVLLVSCDASLENIHFQRRCMPGEGIGWKAAASAISDIAAMGGEARFLLVTIAAPSDTETAFLDDLFRGISGAAAHCGAVIAGGDTTRSPEGVVIDIMALGVAPGGRYMLRGGARPGDVLAVTGWPGLSAAGLLALQAGVEAPPLTEKHLHPLPRLAEGQWLARRESVHAMIDLSDGLLRDAGHIAEAAGIGADIDPDALPVSPAFREYGRLIGVDPRALVLSGGEEYELIIAVDGAAWAGLKKDFGAEFELELTAAGRFTELRGIRVAGEIPDETGFDHFRFG